MKNDDRLRFTLRLPNNLFTIIQNEATQKGVSTNAQILQILWDWVKENVKADQEAM